MNIWNGAFAPQGKQEPVLSKSIGSAVFIPLNEMTPANWRLLDWEFLSNTAKNRIVVKALRNRVVGFVHFMFISKGSKSGGYLQAVLLEEMQDLPSLMDKPDFENYGYEDEPLSPEAERFDSALVKIAGAGVLLTRAAKWAILTTLMFAAEDGGKDEDIEYLRQIVNSDFTDLEDLDMALVWALSVLHRHDIKWLQDWADEAEQILGEAEDKNQL